MISAIVNFFAVVRGLLDLWRYLQRWQKQQALEEIERKRSELERSIADAERAKTPEEAFDAQERIVDSRG